MNENKERNDIQENEESTTQAFNPEFNDKVVELNQNITDNDEVVVNDRSVANAESDATDTISQSLAESEDSGDDDRDDTVESSNNEVGFEHHNESDADDVVGIATQNLENNEHNVGNSRRSRKNRRHTTRALIKESNIALILSAVSIILMLALATLLVVDILPIGRRVAYIGVSNVGTVEPPSSLATTHTIENAKQAVVIVAVTKASGSGTGSGIIITEDGYIVTNYHVVEGATNISILLYQSQNGISAEVIGYSERDDIAVLKADLSEAVALPFANSADCRVGDVVYAIGAPEGIELGWTVTSGIISEPVREIWMADDQGMLEKKMFLLQTDASVNPGNSGGPLINARGEVVGIVTMRRSNSAGLGFALPSSASLEIIEAIIENGNADNVESKISKGRPLIGITGVGLEANTWYTETPLGYSMVDETYANENPDSCIYATVTGVYVTALSPTLDAKNHLQTGDVITHVNDKAVALTTDIINIVNNYNGGDVVKITFVRNGQTKTAEITLGVEK